MGNESNEVEIINFINKTIEVCSERSIVDILPWKRHLYDVINISFALHRYIVIGKLITSVPEALRANAVSTFMNVRKEHTNFTYLSTNCIDMLSNLVSVSFVYGYNLLSKIGVNRVSLSIVLISALLSRSLTSNGIYLDYDVLMGLLNELKSYVLSAMVMVSK